MDHRGGLEDDGQGRDLSPVLRIDGEGPTDLREGLVETHLFLDVCKLMCKLMCKLRSIITRIEVLRPSPWRWTFPRNFYIMSKIGVSFSCFGSRRSPVRIRAPRLGFQSPVTRIVTRAVGKGDVTGLVTDRLKSHTVPYRTPAWDAEGRVLS